MKIFSVSSNSTTQPVRCFSDSSSSTVKKAVLFDTRAACCMLCVTITIEYSRFRSIIRSSILPVEIGSSAEQGSSIRITSGATARARAMQSRCCWPPDIPNAFVLSRSLTSSQSAAC